MNESYTQIADRVRLQAKRVSENCTTSEAYTSCYDSLTEHENLVEMAKNLEESARIIRNSFKEIAREGYYIPAGTTLRKAILSIKKGRFVFSVKQLLRCCAVMMEDAPHIIFTPTTNKRPYLTVLYWATDEKEEDCLRFQRFETVRKEVAVDEIELSVDVSVVYAPSQYVYHVLQKSKGYKLMNCDNHGLFESEELQLQAFEKTLAAFPKARIEDISRKRPLCEANLSSPPSKK